MNVPASKPKSPQFHGIRSEFATGDSFVGPSQPVYYIARSLPQEQGLLHRGLKRRGIEPIMPMITESRRCGRGGMRLVYRFYAPGYSLLKIDTDAEYEKVTGTPGFQKLMRAPGMGGRFIVLLPAAVDLLLRMTNSTPAERTQFPLKIGDFVRVMEGPFTGFNAAVEYVPNIDRAKFTHEDRIKVAVDIFGCPTPIELEIWHVEKLDDDDGLPPAERIR